MTARVEENLKRVHSESAFVDKVGRRITSTAERLESIEQSVGKVEERFRSENQKALVALRDQIVQDTEDKVSTLAGVVTGSEQRIKDFGTYVTRLEARGEQLEREVLGRLPLDSLLLETD